ncbi:radical SAM superfamily protein [Desulfovibrio sp. A2]|nr:radical SAM superfamily protein [Desulfovibrio sp. A2]
MDKEASLCNAVVIVPPVVCHDLDPHTGIPFMPHMAAYLAGALRDAGMTTTVYDCFGINPHQTEVLRSEFLLMGCKTASIANMLPEKAVCFIYCRTIAEFVAVEQLITQIRATRPSCKIVLFENIQAVTSYSLAEVAEEFLAKGCDCILCGEPEDRCATVGQRLHAGLSLQGIPGTFHKGPGGECIREPAAELHDDLDTLPMPAWELWDLEGYWRAGFAHAPARKNTKFLPLLTSRGCPFRCTFCISPSLNPRWRARSAQHVVQEMEFFHDKMGIQDFHISDLNPTVSDERIREICRLLLAKGLSVTWKFAQGTKIETLKNVETLELMAKAGCVYVSFSPETGSSRLLKIMNKPFDHAHALAMAGHMRRLGMRMQAVFLGGVPGETEEDRNASLAYATQLIRAGVDEISTVIFTPLPGAKLAGALSGYETYSQCTPSPNWRADYKLLTRYRQKMYLNLFLQKFLAYPERFFQEIFRTMTRNFETKMEMSLYKQVKLVLLRYLPVLFAPRQFSKKCGQP